MRSLAARPFSRSIPSRFFTVCARALGLFAVFASVLAQAAPGDPNNYQLASGDSIRITVFQNPDLTLDTRVSEDGSITYPLVGRIGIGGIDIGAAERKIGKALLDGGFLKNPQVSIQLMEIRGNKVAVLGQVLRPGSFPLTTTNTRVSQILAEAGGQTPTGDDRIIVTGTRDSKPFRKEIDIDALYRDQQPQNDLLLASGDTVYVPRAPMFYIYGEVSRPGNYRIERNMTMRQALAAAGGLTARGTERRLRVVRANTQGTQERVSVELNDPVTAGDTIYVSESLF